MRWRRNPTLAILTLAAALLFTSRTAGQERPTLDVPFVPTPENVVETMLELANVTKDDILYDLGSGDGRIVITAAKKYRIRGVGYDLDPERVKEARDNARAAGVADRVRFEVQNVFDADFREATVVTMYLLPTVNMKLRPRILSELRPGTRVVSHDFDMGDWTPEKVVTVKGAGGREHTVYLWVVPPRKGGS
jgi:23S rRNA G2445 N2-methylase RlmL